MPAVKLHLCYKIIIKTENIVLTHYVQMTVNSFTMSKWPNKIVTMESTEQNLLN